MRASPHSTRGLNGNSYLKTGIARDRLDGNQAFGFLDDAVGDIQAETGSFAYALGGEEGLKDFRPDFWRNAGAIVGDFDQNIVVVSRGADAELPAVLHDIGGVVDQIGPHLVQLAPVGHDFGQVGSIITRNDDAA